MEQKKSAKTMVVKSDYKSIVPVTAKPVGDNYEVAIGGGNSLILVRDVDFGRMPNTTKPCLFKSGAERLIMSAGLCSEFELIDSVKIHDVENPYFYFEFKCSLYLRRDGKELHITDGYGSANSNEKSCGRAGKFDVANARMKMAKKRAMVDAALMLGQLSNAFSQDIENEDVIGSDVKIKATKDEDPISTQQVKRIWTIAGQNGFSQDEVKKILAKAGHESTKTITQKEYDGICALFSNPTTKGENK